MRLSRITGCFLRIFLWLGIVGCNSQIDPAPDRLEKLGIIGNWEIQSRTIGGVTSLEAFCCEFLEFFPDENTKDFSGTFSSMSTGSSVTGSFTINDDQITFFLENRDQECMIQIDENILTLIYPDQDMSEDWARVE